MRLLWLWNFFSPFRCFAIEYEKMNENSGGSCWWCLKNIIVLCEPKILGRLEFVQFASTFVKKNLSCLENGRKEWRINFRKVKWKIDSMRYSNQKLNFFKFCVNPRRVCIEILMYKVTTFCVFSQSSFLIAKQSIKVVSKRKNYIKYLRD